MKTSTIIQVTHDDGRTYHCRVKLDSKKFPYIVIDNDKLVVNSTIFPRETMLMGLERLRLDIVSGLDELGRVLVNPELTCDKLSLSQSLRVG